jgi:hypothetical protein
VGSLLACALLLAASDDAQREANAHFNRGVALAGRGNQEGALAEFKEAYRLAPAWQVLFNLGVVHDNLSHPVQALEAFETYLSKGGSAVPRDKRQLVDPLLVKLRKQVGEIVIRNEGESVEIELDGVSRGSTPLKGRLYAMPGRHRVTGQRADSTSSTTDVEVRAGDRVVVVLAFAASPPPPSSPAAASPADAPERDAREEAPIALEPKPTVADKPPVPAASEVADETTEPGSPTLWYQRWYVWTAVAVVAAGVVTAIAVAETRPRYDVRVDTP